jgi:hypothetical protein
MTRAHNQPYEREFKESFELLHRMSRVEHDALLRDAGILDEDGDLAARYRPVEERADKSEPSPSVASS